MIIVSPGFILFYMIVVRRSRNVPRAFHGSICTSSLCFYNRQSEGGGGAILVGLTGVFLKCLPLWTIGLLGDEEEALDVADNEPFVTVILEVFLSAATLAFTILSNAAISLASCAPIGLEELSGFTCRTPATDLETF